jgi:hypothetical protein
MTGRAGEDTLGGMLIASLATRVAPAVAAEPTSVV